MRMEQLNVFALSFLLILLNSFSANSKPTSETSIGLTSETSTAVQEPTETKEVQSSPPLATSQAEMMNSANVSGRVDQTQDLEDTPPPLPKTLICTDSAEFELNLDEVVSTLADIILLGYVGDQTSPDVTDPVLSSITGDQILEKKIVKKRVVGMAKQWLRQREYFIHLDENYLNQHPGRHTILPWGTNTVKRETEEDML